MKKLIIIAFALLTVFSCKDDTNMEVFDKTADERIFENKKEFFNKLTSNNWVIELFPKAQDKYGGYSIFATFDENYKTILTNEFGITASDTNYDIISRSGSMLTFNEYNDGIHFFSNPSGDKPKGLIGNVDYEFVYQRTEGDIIYTKGAKTRNEIRFVKTDLSAQDYLAKLKSNDDYVFDSGRILVDFSVGGEKIDFTCNSRLFQYTIDDELEKTSFIFTDKGIRFFAPFKVNGIEVFELILDKTNELLKSEDGKVILKFFTPPLDFNSQGWTFKNDNSSVSPKVITMFNSTKLEHDSVMGSLYSQYNIPGSESLQSNIHIGLWVFNGTVVSKNISFFSEYSVDGSIGRTAYKTNFNSFVNSDGEFNIEITKDVPGFNWKPYNEPMLLPMLDFIINNSVYKFEVIQTDVKVKMISKVDPEVWFILSKS